MIFVSTDGKLRQGFQSDREGFRKWFCNSSLDQAKTGVAATYDGKNYLMTDQWDTLRRAQFMGKGDYQLSHHFC